MIFRVVCTLKVTSIWSYIYYIEHGISIRPTILRKVDVKIHSNDQCEKRTFGQVDITRETYLCTMNENGDNFGKKSSCEVSAL